MDIENALKQIDSLVNDLFQYHKETLKDVSDVDKKVNAIYHEIENKNYDVVSGYKKLAELQEQLRLRRYFKGEMIKTQSVVANLRDMNSKIANVQNKIQEVNSTMDQFEGNKLRLVNTK